MKKRSIALLLVLSLVFTAMPMTTLAVQAQEEPATSTNNDQPVITITRIGDVDMDDEPTNATRAKYYVNRASGIENGKVDQGTFKLTGWFGIGNNFTVIASSGNTGGKLGFSLASAYYDIPCDGRSRVITRETGWKAGTYRWAISNYTGKSVSYSLTIYNP